MTSHSILITKSTTTAAAGTSTTPQQAKQNLQLEGSCLCTRNRYTIHLSLPTNSSSTTSSSSHPIIHASTPILTVSPTHIRIPLCALRSSTHALYPGESHAAIRRVFTPEHARHTKRHFCGFCGSELSFWSEDSMDRSVEGWVFISLGTLGEGWDEILEGLGIEDGISFGRSANGGERFEWKVVEFDGEVIAAWNDADEEDDEGGLGSGATDGPMTKRKVDAMTE